MTTFARPSRSRSSRPGSRAALALAFVAAVAAVLPVASVAAAAPAGTEGSGLRPPTELRAVHRSGQTFLTWRERADVSGERYLIYRYREPIGPDPAGETRLIATVGERSSRMWSERIGEGGWRMRYLERAVIRDGAPPLATEQGLFVWTPGRTGLGGEDEGDAYYAVVTAKGDRRSDAATTDAVREHVAAPRAVLAKRIASGRIRVMVQYMDMRTWNGTFEAPRAENGWLGYGRDGRGVADALVLAHTYAIAMPVASACPGGDVPRLLPVVLVLHGKGDGTIPPDLSPPDWCAIEVRPTDRDDSRWFGFGLRTDYRRGDVPGPGDEIGNLTEARLLRMLDELIDDPELGSRVDARRIYVTGRSMGGAGTLGLAIRFPGLFAAGLARAAVVDYRDMRARGLAMVARRWGLPEHDLPIRLFGPSRWIDPIAWAEGTGVWTWQDHAFGAKVRPGAEMAPIGLLQGLQDGVADPDDQLVPLARSLERADRTFGLVLRDGPHKIPGWDGLPATMGLVRGVPFAGLRVVRDETVPALGRDSVTRAKWPPRTAVAVNTRIEWSASWRAWDGAPLDRAGWWGMSLRATDGRVHEVDVTPRRVQRFAIAPGARYRYVIRSLATDRVLQSGIVTADAHGLIVVRCPIGPKGIRLVLRPASA